MKTTRNSLLIRMANPGEQIAWEEFYQTYAEAVQRYGLKLGLDTHRAQDVLQETMTTLMRLLPDFRYDPLKGKFRNFLLTIVHQKALRTIRQLARRSEISADAPEQSGRTILDSLAAEDKDAVGEQDEKRWRLCLMEQCLERLRKESRTQEKTFDIFFAYAVQNKSCKEVAQTFEVQENLVYQIKNRLTAQLEEMMKDLMEDWD